jgi:hypothetical protein
VQVKASPAGTLRLREEEVPTFELLTGPSDPFNGRRIEAR